MAGPEAKRVLALADRLMQHEANEDVGECRWLIVPSDPDDYTTL
ncbi:MAG TPA: hypothetical protein VL287_06305 [Gemmatimonadales bacterium]|nr:hypothetical protein [Gemmatimonadales bacterium]